MYFGHSVSFKMVRVVFLFDLFLGLVGWFCVCFCLFVCFCRLHFWLLPEILIAKLRCMEGGGML